mgnify:CR=1 FL=1
MIKSIYNKTKWLKSIKRAYDQKVVEKRLEKDPLFFAKREFQAVFGREMDLDNPTNLIEKFYWLELNADLSQMSRCADKFAVRGFVEEKGCSEILNTLYKKWDTPEEIDFSVLPQSFILKINNGSGDVTIVTDKSQANRDEIVEHFRKLFKTKYGVYNAQFHYQDIKPCIIAEKLLPVENIPYSCSIIDYKIWCFNGVPECIWVAYDRKGEHVYMDLFDTGWNSMPQHMNSIPHYQYHPENVIPRPVSLDDMLKYAAILSQGFPEVRVDFYEIGGKVVFGEMTFTSGYGFYTKEYYEYLGSKTDLSIVRKR